ncbi:hypothetical protein PTKIN_Ptkin14bG0200700 [Pterospermum kingtungense]
MILNNSGCPWILGGDFNVIKTDEEKVGVAYNSAAMENFSSFIESIRCIDLPLSRGKFTWSSNKDSPIFCRLDRFLFSPDVLLHFFRMWSRIFGLDLFPITILFHWKHMS